MPKQRKNEIKNKKPLTSGSSSEKGAIQKSNQLAAKLKNSTRKRKHAEANEPASGRAPMPSLEELEAYYNDSERDEQSNHESTTPIPDVIVIDSDDEPFSYKNKLEIDLNAPSTSKLNQEECNTANTSQLTENKIISLDTASKYAYNFSRISHPAELPDYLPSPPVVPHKRPKKSGTPYIVGCKDRPQVIKKSKSNFCKCDKYGIDIDATQSDEDDSCLIKRCYSKKVNLSKSIFNAKGEEIAARLVEADKIIENDRNAAYSNLTQPSTSQLKDTTVINSTSNIGMKPEVISSCITVDDDSEGNIVHVKDSNSISDIEMKPEVIASYVTVDDLEDNIVEVEVVLPKPFFNDDCYLIEENCNKIGGNESKKYTDVNKDVIVINDDEKSEESACNVENICMANNNNMATEIVDTFGTNVISFERTKETLYSQPSCSYNDPYNTMSEQNNNEFYGIGPRKEYGRLVYLDIDDDDDDDD